DAGTHYARIVRASLEERGFGMRNLFPETVKVQTIRFENTQQKQEAVEAVKNYLVAGKFKARMASVVANAVDELVMNAMFDAPVDALGRATYKAISRAMPRKRSDREKADLHVAYDGTYVGIMAVDLFGSVDKAGLLNHIGKIYTEEEYRVKTAVA